MSGLRRTLWLQWAMSLTLLAAVVALPSVLPMRQGAWYPAQQAVAAFALALLSVIAGLGTFTLRETLVKREMRAGGIDPRSPGDSLQMRKTLLALWGLCLLIGLFGSLLAYGAASPTAVWPYGLAAVVLLAIHSPRARLFRPPGGSSDTTT